MDKLISLVMWIAVGIGLFILEAILVNLPFAPTIFSLFAELSWIVLIVVILIMHVPGRKWFRGALCVIGVTIGVFTIPYVSETVRVLWTSDTRTGMVMETKLDEQDNGNRTVAKFYIKDYETCQVDTYVSQDIIHFPFIYHDDSSDTRDRLIASKGRTVTFKEVGTRRTKRDMPFLGSLGGMIGSFFGADWTQFPNIYEVEPSNATNPC